MKKIKSVLFLVFLLTMSVANISFITIPEEFPRFQNVPIRLASFEPHDTITISENADFLTEGWPGDGTLVSPYIIEALEIVSEDTCIDISNTDVHFIIRNCTLTSPNTGVGIGIYLSDLSNGTIQNCTISSLRNGIFSESVEDCVFSNNTIAECTGYAMIPNGGENCTIVNNTVFDCEGFGYFINNLQFSTVEANSAFNCEEISIAIVSSENVTTIDNVVSNSGRFGLYVLLTTNCSFINNTLVNSGFGFGNSIQYWNHNFSDNIVNGKSLGLLYNTNDTEIDGNQFGQVFLVDCFNVSIELGVFYNASVGISLSGCTNCTINDTEISGNLYGIDLTDSINITLIDNTLIDCGIRFNGDNLTYWNITEIGNTVNGKQFGYFLSQEKQAINGDYYGQIVLVDSNHLRITNGTFDSVTVGLVINSCFNCSASNASFIDNYSGGILVTDSSNCTLTNMTIRGSRSSGLEIHTSDNATVTASKIYENGGGISVYSSDDFLFDFNRIHDNLGQSIYLSETNYGVIRNNSMNGNEGALRLYIVNWLEIADNTITGSSYDGIYMDFTSGVIITGNKIYGNMGFGIKVRSYALYSEIYNNMIGFNEAGNAVDSGIFNEWDDGAGIGNIWSDYSGTGVYSVGIGTDNYPLGFLSRPDDVQYVMGEVVPDIAWDIRLPNPDSYTLLWNSLIISQGSLNTSLDHITKSIVDLSVDSYNLTIEVIDESGFSLVDNVNVTVIDEPVTTTTSTTTTTTETTSTTSTSSTTSTLPPDNLLTLIIVSVGIVGVIVILLVMKQKNKL